MTIERTVVTTTGIVSLISTAASKCYLITSLSELRKWKNCARVPALVIPDILLMTALSLGMLWAINMSGRRKNGVLRYGILGLSLVLFGLVSTINSVGVAYFQQSGALVEWSTVFDFLVDFRAASSFFVANSGPSLFWIWLHVFFFGCVLFFRWKRNGSEYYTPLLAPKTLDERASYGVSTWLSAILVIFYTSWALLTGPKVGNWRMLSEPQLVSFSKAALEALFGDYFIRFSSPHDGGDMYDECETISSMYDVFSNQKRRCTKRMSPDYSFLRRTPKSEIKNVVWLYLESARNDILPFKNDSAWAVENLSAELRQQNPFSPFLSSLIEKGLYFENFRTISTYTLKALLGGLCSVVPLPANRLIEWNLEPYRKCLPRALHENGWETLFMEPGTADWEHQRENLAKIGFNTSVAVEEMDAGIFVGPYRSRFQEVNYFGNDDLPIIEPLIDWMNKNRREEKPSFATLLTNVNHDPYDLPKGWESVDYVKNNDPKVNKFLNTARYTDNFVKEFVKALQDNGILKDTLLVVMGDHGMSLGEHSRVGTNENSEEQLLKIPCLLYSENEAWRKKYPPKRHSDVHSSLDMLPTIMDMLNEDPKTPTSLFTEHYEGGSLVRRPKRDPLHISLINPGGHSTVFWQTDKKVVLKGYSDAVFYDLQLDPQENDPKPIDVVEGADGKWFNRILNFNELLMHKMRQAWNSTAEPVE
ncbi:Catalase-peroxidase [Paramicrosporidium saccamoebae]|uniref:Catalase-peroxidase n=1 Tax=Paramicrosporidium saccamoebae TaxID=1246581 RepID=A0A2H9TPM6_9FUNG|nr:Catalase-peroxidase [Paramicrosporidium saccamoebae]